MIFCRFFSFEVPKAPGLPLIGSAINIIRSGGPPFFHKYIDSVHSMIGPIFRENIGPSSSVVFISHPTEMRRIFTLEGKYPRHYLPPSWILYNQMFNYKRGLLFMDGEEWGEYRRPLNRHLLKENIGKELNHVYEFVIEKLLSEWIKHYDGLEIPHLEHQLYKHSISAVVGTLMGSSYLVRYDEFQEDIIEFASKVVEVFKTTAALNSLPISLAVTLKLPKWKNFVCALDSSLMKCEEMVKKMMIVAASDGLIKKLINDGIESSVVEILVIDLLLAAGDTTAYTTQWAFYLLGLDNENGIKGKMLSGQDEERKNLAKGIMREALRLYPPAVFISRILPKSEEVLGYTLREDELVMLSLWSSGRDEVNFPKPNEFLPSRWDKDNNEGEKINPSAFLPFALGARSCVGSKLAQHLITSTILSVTKRLRLDTLEKVNMILEPVPVPDKPIRIKIRKL